jgi:lipopolysaccharide/colanic/teichoic acid biosynthesis glycosyltransferase
MLHPSEEEGERRVAVESAVPTGGMDNEAIPHGHEVIGLTRVQFGVKRGFDVLGASLLIVVTLPVWLAVALAVKLSSPGPAVFRLEAMGKDGKPFRMFKFRSMVKNAHAMVDQVVGQGGSGPMFKVKSDPRVTRVGAFLRATSLDELPQLLNVIRGEMSLVGPRALSAARYDPEYLSGWRAVRLTVLPGITGPWQIGGRIQDFDECCRIDASYVTNWSFGRDLWILLRTVGAVLTRRGAH